MKFIITSALALSLLLISACSNQDTEKTKQEAAKATEQIKEGSKVAAVELKKDAKQAAVQGKAIAPRREAGPVHPGQARERELGVQDQAPDSSRHRRRDRRPHYQGPSVSHHRRSRGQRRSLTGAVQRDQGQDCGSLASRAEREIAIAEQRPIVVISEILLAIGAPRCASG